MLAATLKESVRLDNTLIIFTSDHGLAVGGRHGLMGKQNLYEHVKPPLILAGPGIPQGSSGALVYLFDLLPTLCDYSGLETPERVEGRSLLPLMEGKRARVRDWLLGAYRGCQRMVRDDRWKLVAYQPRRFPARVLPEARAAGDRSMRPARSHGHPGLLLPAARPDPQGRGRRAHGGGQGETRELGAGITPGICVVPGGAIHVVFLVPSGKKYPSGLMPLTMPSGPVVPPLLPDLLF